VAWVFFSCKEEELLQGAAELLFVALPHRVWHPSKSAELGPSPCVDCTFNPCTKLNVACTRAPDMLQSQVTQSCARASHFGCAAGLPFFRLPPSFPFLAAGQSPCQGLTKLLGSMPFPSLSHFSAGGQSLPHGLQENPEQLPWRCLFLVHCTGQGRCGLQ